MRLLLPNPPLLEGTETIEAEGQRSKGSFKSALPHGLLKAKRSLLPVANYGLAADFTGEGGLRGIHLPPCLPVVPAWQPVVATLQMCVGSDCVGNVS